MKLIINKGKVFTLNNLSGRLAYKWLIKLYEVKKVLPEKPKKKNYNAKLKLDMSFKEALIKTTKNNQ